MGTIDWSSEEADVWMRSVRAADKAQRYHGVRFRPPQDATEAKLAADVARRRFRSSFGALSGGAGSRTVAPAPSSVRAKGVHCAKCGRSGRSRELRLWRTVWGIGTREDYYVCALGCQKGKGH